jgi:hypothetical protein
MPRTKASLESTIEPLELRIKYPESAPVTFGGQDFLRGAALDAILQIERVPLADIRPLQKPGVYVLFFTKATRSLSKYGELLSSGQFPVYIGKAKLLPDRLSRHRRAIVAAKGLAIGDFTVGVIYTDTLAMAGAAEEMLIEAIRPPWNEKALSGFGSRDPGSTRSDQRPSGFDCLHQRDWVQAPTTDEKAAANKALKVYLASGYVRSIFPELAS